MRARISSLRDNVLARHLAVALLGLVVVVLVVESVSDYRNTQLAAMAYLGIAAGGLTVLTGLNGQLSLGHGALMAIGAYTSALLLPDNESSLPLSVVVLAAVLVTLVVGAAVGLAAARLHGPYLAGATLALAVAVPGIALYFKETLGGEQGLRVVMPDIPVWVLDAVFFVTGQDLTRSRFTAYVGWLTLIVVFVLLANLGAGRTGRRWRAVRDDEVAAELAGIDLGRARVSAFMVSAAAAGAAGAILAFTVKLAAPSAFTLTLSLTLLAAIVLGGLGSLAGALIGAALLTFLPSVVTDLGTDAGLSDIQAAELAPLVYGLVMVAVILLAPAGIVGSLRGALLRARSRRRTPPTSSTGSSTTSSTASTDAATRTTPGDSDTASTTPATTSKGTAS
jgi:branched-chain amino acid transport system permease protein